MKIENDFRHNCPNMRSVRKRIPKRVIELQIFYLITTTDVNAESKSNDIL